MARSERQKLRFVRRLTEAPLQECVRALRKTGGDEVEAAKLLRSPEQNVRDRGWLTTRSLAPGVAGGPPSDRELALQDALEQPLQPLRGLAPVPEGYPAAWIDALARAAVEHRDDAFIVFADWLQEHGDPRGELIALQHERWSRGENRPTAAEQGLIRSEADRLLGELTTDRWPVQLDWELGFVRELFAALDRQDENHAEIWLAELSRFVAHPSCRLLRSLCIGWIGRHMDYGRVAQMLGEHPPPILDTLSLGDPHPRRGNRLGAMDALEALPALRCLALRGFAVHLAELRFPQHPRLTALTLGLDHSGLWFALQHRWPAVEHLQLDLAPTIVSAGEALVEEIARDLLQGLSTAFPRLRRLELRGGALHDGGSLDVTVIRSLVAQAAALGRLEQLVTEVQPPPSLVEALTAVLPALEIRAPGA